MEIELVAGSSALGGGLIGGLVVKIVFDWLKLGRKNGTEPCADHKDCVAQVNQNRSCINIIKKDVAVQEATHREREAMILQRLKDGDDRMREMGADIQIIKRSVSNLITTINLRLPPKGGAS